MGLLEASKKIATKSDVVKAIRAMHVLQIDTISVVARSPYLVLFSRLGYYPPRWLDESLAEGKLFEYWSHAACFLPIEDYPLYRAQQLNMERHGFNRAPARIEADPVGHLNLLDHVHENGEVRATDFEHEGGRKGNGWWDWKPDKLRLETLFTAGEIMVARRDNFHRVYDVRERVLPKHFRREIDLPTREQMHRTFSLKAVKAMGITQARWMGDYFRHARKAPSPHPDSLVDAGELIRVSVEGWKNAAYVHRDHRALLKRAQRNEHSRHACNASFTVRSTRVGSRTRARDLGFRVPHRVLHARGKRKYGYFTLPMLINGSLIGRLDAKVHRAQSVFELKTIHFEANARKNLANARRSSIRIAR